MLSPIKRSTGRQPLSTRQMVQPPAREFYESTLRILTTAGIRFVVGGAFALKHYAGIARDTKDLDVFLERPELDRAMELLAASGYETEVTFPHWLGKAYSGEHFVDFIFSSANGLCPVDGAWFKHALKCTMWGVPVLLCPIEEVIWTKCFVMERERFDGADVCHLIEARGETIDWRRLIDRFGDQWRVLLGHLVFYSFIFPDRREVVPRWVLHELTERMQRERHAERDRVCRGTLVSREQYLVDLRERGYEDARVPPHGDVPIEQIDFWTDAIGKIK
jgi:hypothetical protein